MGDRRDSRPVQLSAGPRPAPSRLLGHQPQTDLTVLPSRGSSRPEESSALPAPENEVRAMDFMAGQTFHGRKLRILNFVEGATRFCPAIDARVSYVCFQGHGPAGLEVRWGDELLQAGQTDGIRLCRSVQQPRPSRAAQRPFGSSASPPPGPPVRLGGETTTRQDQTSLRWKPPIEQAQALLGIRLMEGQGTGQIPYRCRSSLGGTNRATPASGDPENGRGSRRRNLRGSFKAQCLGTLDDAPSSIIAAAAIMVQQ